MIKRMLKKEFLRSKIITATLFLFITLSALLVASSCGVIMELFGAMDVLFEKSSAPHFVQMQAGEINQDDIDEFTSTNEMVKQQQTLEMLNIDGGDIYLGDDGVSEATSVMDVSFVKQSQAFDFLLDLENKIVKVSKGEIAVPIYYMQKNDLKRGDTITVKSGVFKQTFVITEFVRDVQMNPSIISSKRFVVNEDDWNIIKESIGKSEYLIEFQIENMDQINEFEKVYQSSGLPQNGTPLTYPLYKTINAITDGIVVAVIIIISLLLILIAMLCVRFTMITTMEEDYREIGVMKGIGIESKEIKKLYLAKYIVIAGVGSLCGFVCSLFISQAFTKNIAMYMGIADKTWLNYALPFAGAFVVFLLVVAFCQLVLRKFRKITAVDAIRTGGAPYKGSKAKGGKLSKSKCSNLNIFLGVKEAIGQFKTFGILCMVFISCSFLMIVPFHFLNTMESSEFITYMGVGKSDIRIDIQQSDNMEKEYMNVLSYLQKDNSIEKYAAFITQTFQVKNSEGKLETISIESGDLQTFPLTYLNGGAPNKSDEIALSYMNANEFEKEVGDKLTLVIEGVEQNFIVSGIYQDITNGGKTAKATFEAKGNHVLRYLINVQVKPKEVLVEKAKEYSHVFDLAKVTDTKDYLSQTLGAPIKQLRLVTKLAMAISIFIAILITAMFLKMLIAKNTAQIAIMKSLGFSNKNIRVQYITQLLLVLFVGMLLGTLAAGTLGQGLISALGSMVGAANIAFVINPVMSYIICPLSLVVTVTITTIISSKTIKKIEDLKAIVE